jgi:medium-chain acyl-[acyl-carrier-protein] hydrolase
MKHLSPAKSETSFLFRSPNNSAKYRIFFFPYAGGGGSIGEPYRQLFPSNIDLIAIQLPGRENRITEQPYDEINALISALLPEISLYLDRPFAFWGHCSGALIAFELTKKLAHLFDLQPNALVISACSAPEFISQSLPMQFHTLSDMEFFLEIQKLMAEATYNNSETNQAAKAVKILLPGIRADFSFYENYCYQPSHPLSCPLYALGGTQDRLVKAEHLLAWQKYSHGNFTHHLLDKQHHYFVNDCRETLARLISAWLLG